MDLGVDLLLILPETFLLRDYESCCVAHACPRTLNVCFCCSVSALHQEKLDFEVLCKENPLLPETAEHPEESEDVSGAACGAAVGCRR